MRKMQFLSKSALPWECYCISYFTLLYLNRVPFIIQLHKWDSRRFGNPGMDRDGGKEGLGRRRKEGVMNVGTHLSNPSFERVHSGTEAGRREEATSAAKFRPSSSHSHSFHSFLTSLFTALSSPLPFPSRPAAYLNFKRPLSVRPACSLSPPGFHPLLLFFTSCYLPCTLCFSVTLK